MPPILELLSCRVRVRGEVHGNFILMTGSAAAPARPSDDIVCTLPREVLDFRTIPCTTSSYGRLVGIKDTLEA